MFPDLGSKRQVTGLVFVLQPACADTSREIKQSSRLEVMGVYTSSERVQRGAVEVCCKITSQPEEFASFSWRRGEQLYRGLIIGIKGYKVD
jgi:hypothetical protein